MAKSIADKLADLEKQKAELKEQEKQLELQKHAVIGRVVSGAMENDPELQRKVEMLLSQGVKKNSERALFGLEKLPSNRGRPVTTA